MTTWTRPRHGRPPEFARPFLTAFSILVWFFGLGSAVQMGFGWGSAVALVVVALMQAFVVRQLRMGVYLGELGLLVRTMFRSRLVPWSQLHGVRVDERAGSRVLAIVTRDGAAIDAVWQFSFDDPVARRRLDYPTLRPAELDALVAELNDTLAATRRSAPRS